MSGVLFAPCLLLLRMLDQDRSCFGASCLHVHYSDAVYSVGHGKGGDDQSIPRMPLSNFLSSTTDPFHQIIRRFPGEDQLQLFVCRIGLKLAHQLIGIQGADGRVVGFTGVIDLFYSV